MTDFSQSECRKRVEILPGYLREVLRLMATGACTKEIADELKLTPSTVYVYRERVYSKMQVNNLAVATRIAVGARLI